MDGIVQFVCFLEGPRRREKAASTTILLKQGVVQRATWDAANAALLPIFQRKATNNRDGMYNTTL